MACHARHGQSVALTFHTFPLAGFHYTPPCHSTAFYPCHHQQISSQLQPAPGDRWQTLWALVLDSLSGVSEPDPYPAVYVPEVSSAEPCRALQILSLFHPLPGASLFYLLLKLKTPSPPCISFWELVPQLQAYLCHRLFKMPHGDPA